MHVSASIQLSTHPVLAKPLRTTVSFLVTRKVQIIVNYLNANLKIPQSNYNNNFAVKTEISRNDYMLHNYKKHSKRSEK